RPRATRLPASSSAATNAEETQKINGLTPDMKGLLVVAGAIDGISRFFGRIAAWLVLASCLVSAGNAASRYLFSASSNAWLEIQWQMFAGISLLGAADVLRRNEHVRVDLLYGSRSDRGKLWTDVIGL